jgi:hypothetical protein
MVRYFWRHRDSHSRYALYLIEDMWSNGDHGSIGCSRARLEMKCVANIGAAPLRRYRNNGTVLPNWVSASSGVEVRILMLAVKMIHLAYSLLRV